MTVLLKYGCGVRFGFCCFFSAALSQCSFAIIGDFLVGYVPLLALVFLPLQFPVVVLVIFTAATYPTTSLRRLALRALSFASFSPTLSLYHKTWSHSPIHRRGESEWITRSHSLKHRRGERIMDSPTFLSTSRSAYFCDLHVSTSEHHDVLHHDVYTGGNLLRIMLHFQARTSTYGFPLNGILFGATFFS